MAESAEDSPGRRFTRPRRPSRAVALVAAVVLVLAGAGLAIALGGEGGGSNPDSSAGSSSTTEQADSRPAPAQVVPVSGLSASEQIDQVLLAGIDGSKVDEEIVEQVGEHQLGGILVESENWPDREAGVKVVDGLRETAEEAGDVPPLIVAAQEGGRYRSLADLPPDRTELEVGDEGSPEEVTKWASESAAALRESGFDLNLFPVADVASLDSPLADRAFSDSTPLTTELTAAALRGCEEEELACAPLHFPGLGAANQDPSQAPAGVSLDAASLGQRDLPPFEAAFEEGAPAVVLSLAFYAAYSGTTPAALSPEVATGLLRERLGFEGVAITDDLNAGAISGSYEVGEAAVLALKAGADLIQISDPGDVEEARDAIAKALERGDLRPGRLAEAVERVLELKRELGLIEEPGGGSRSGS